MITRLRSLSQMRRAAVRWWLRSSTPAQWVRHFIYLLGILILALGGTAVGILQFQANEVDHLTLTIVPAIDANGEVIQAMADADSGLLGYQITHDPKMLTSYRGAHERVVAALATLQNKVGSGLGDQQRRAVEQWWSYALSAEQAVTRGETIDVLQGDALFNNFRQANSALDEHLRSGHAHALSRAQAISRIRIIMVIIVTLVALLTTLILGLRYSRSVSQPIIALRDTMSRQREGDLGAHAREDLGSPEIRSLATDFNVLAEKNLDSLRRVEEVSTRMASLVDLSLALGQKLSLDALLIRIVGSARQVLGARYAALGVLDASGTGLAEFVTVGLSPEEEAAIGELPQGLGLLGAIIRDPQPLRLEHMADDPRSVGFPPHHPKMDSFLGVPIVIHGEVFGNLYLTDKVGGPFSVEDEQLARSFALQAAVAVENARRYEAERQRANMLEAVREIERAIRAAPDTQQALDVLCSMLGEGLEVDRVIAKVGDVDRTLVLGAQWHQPLVGDLPENLVPYIGPLAEELWLSADRLVVNDFLAPEMEFRQGQIFHGYSDARAVIMVPIGLGDRVIGVIYVITVHQPRRWTESEINMVQQVTAFMAQIIVEHEYWVHQNEYIERLERFERQQTNFVVTVSHELRTPLTSIAGYLELLRDGYAGGLTGEQQRMLEVMDRNTNRLDRLIEDLLVLNRSENDNLKVEVTDVSMRELVIDACNELPPIAHNHVVELDIDAGPPAAVVRGDREQLKSAVVNIVSNAIKFSHPGGVVTIRCTLDQGANRVRVMCQDQGIGIPADDQAQLFSRFFRASNATEMQIPGTGIGLAVVKQIIEDHGGSVRLASVEGEGTTVIIGLPSAPPGSSRASR